MKHTELRKAFNSHFTDLKHKQVVSSSLIPHNDPTLLFTNAGMNQFKNAFLGTEKLDYNRAVSIQKCVRAGGKHNDLENVGYTTRHHTFFEMMGNFSFGDYFKKEAIHYAWDLLTNKLAIPKDKLYVTVFETDDEAEEIWHKQEGVPMNRIFRLGEKDNFWRMGETGPCGPCSEIYYDHGPGATTKKNSVFGQDDDRYVEIWNLVFMQYFEDASGLTPLPKPSVDTGAGLERVAAVLQGKYDNYQTDLFESIIGRAADHGKVSMNDWYTSPLSAAFKVVGDHARAASFLIADGILPSNEGRGYVLRRILRRAIRYAQKISSNENVFADVCAAVVQEMGPFYPELENNKKQILTSVTQETQKFLATLSQGTQIIESHLHDLKKAGKNQVDGKTAFKLYDTFGFPIDLTQLIAREQGVDVNIRDFDTEMANARQKAKQARKSHLLGANDKHLAQWSSNVAKNGATIFTGYKKNSEAQVKALALSNGETEVSSLKEGESGFAIFPSSPFYAEGGGQAGDHGEITDGQTVVEVIDTTKMNDQHIHHVHVKSGNLKLGDTYNLNVLTTQRSATAKNHSATHLLHAALKNVLGSHVGQAGSLVNDQKLRFDFSHPSSLTAEELTAIETLVNEQIAKALPVHDETVPYKDALKKGAVAMFGEKYGDNVRVLSMGGFSMELCGGTHVHNTSEIGVFKIVSESSVSAGVRRMEAITGLNAYNYLNKNTLENLDGRRATSLTTHWEAYMGDIETQVSDVVKTLQKDVQDLKKQLQSAKSASVDVDSLLKQAKTVATAKSGDVSLLVQAVDIEDRKILSDVVDKLRDHSQNLVVVLVGQGATERPFLAACNKALKSVHCGNITKALTEKFGGKGGGRPDYAQGSLTQFDLAQATAIVQSQL